MSEQILDKVPGTDSGGVLRMKDELWLKRRHSNPPRWHSYDLSKGIMATRIFIGNDPPGEKAGWFWFNDNEELEILLEQRIVNLLEVHR